MSSFRTRREGYLNREDIQPIKQITTEGPSADSGLQVTVGGRDYPNVSADSTSAADTLKTHAPVMFPQCLQTWRPDPLHLQEPGSPCRAVPLRATGASSSRRGPETILVYFQRPDLRF